MNKKEFKSVTEFLEFLNLQEKTTRTIGGDGEFAYFELKPYEKDNTIIRGWIESISSSSVSVTLKYREFGLGSIMWNIETADKLIKSITYYYNG